VVVSISNRPLQSVRDGSAGSGGASHGDVEFGALQNRDSTLALLG